VWVKYLLSLPVTCIIKPGGKKFELFILWDSLVFGQLGLEIGHLGRGKQRGQGNESQCGKEQSCEFPLLFRLTVGFKLKGTVPEVFGYETYYKFICFPTSSGIAKSSDVSYSGLDS
jgi:hypothetical protein